ncbi:MAG: hypothetical protein V4447_14765 [Pseudomonadota bacterium]
MTIMNVVNDGEDGLAILAFKVQALQFDLNRDMKFISMKDQLIRGRTLILAAHQAGLIGPNIMAKTNEANVIVIGGGIGGVSAALMACELGFSVKLVDAASECFSLLGLGSDRLFSATVYDWPHEHSGSHAFPYMDPLRDTATAAHLRSTAIALRFPAKAMVGSDLRKLFLKQLSDYTVKYAGSLDVLCDHRIDEMGDINSNPASKSVLVRVNNGANAKFLKSQIVVFALGFGLDKSSAQTAAAKDFFSYSGLEADISKALAGNRVVRIIGAGDGGLQEALRFVLDDAWHDLHRCVSELQNILSVRGHEAWWSQMCGRIQSAEDQAVRALMWGYTENCVYQELEQVYQREMDKLLEIAPNEVTNWYAKVVRKVDLEIQLVDKCAYSMKAYGLNRWLTGLLQRSSIAGSGMARLLRTAPTALSGVADIELSRMGFAATEKQTQIGTANASDLLRRIAFQGIPMNLDPII